MLPVEDAFSLPLLYHANSAPWLNVEAYTEQPYEIENKQMEGIGNAIPLPAPDRESELMKIFRRRRSCRSYLPNPLPLGEAATLLGGAYGLGLPAEFPGGVKLYPRSAPSAGGLYPLELYALVQRIPGLNDGLHHYNAVSHSLEPLKASVTPGDIWQLLLAQSFLANANVVIFICAVFARTLKKYGARGYRYILFEAGHVAQNICLLAVEKKLGSLCLGGFADSKLNAFLGIDGVNEAVIYCIGVGHPAA
jgi:SagB-type dehydrogenase family enzyme